MKIIECPRDAMQGLKHFIPTDRKIEYINKLLSVGFDTIDFGSFVSPKAIPQMKDTAAVLKGLDLSKTRSKLLAIVANERGAKEALQFEEIHYLGFPLSVSETFQMRNTNKSIDEALDSLKKINDLAVKEGREVVAYLSMGFGNPYGDQYSEELILKFTDILYAMNIKIISLADTIGVANTDQIEALYRGLSNEFADVEFGIHLHSTYDQAYEKIESALRAGCQRFDGALKGYGGCPMAEDELVGNIPTEVILSVLESKIPDMGLDYKAFQQVLQVTSAYMA